MHLEKDWADVPGEQVDEELWDQDWDDDVLDDEFSVQLRYVCTNMDICRERKD